MKRLVWSALASLSLAIPMLAHATDAYVAGNVNLRAGPDISYPLVDQLPAGTEIDVQGCTQGWEWCDVINDGDGNRGWIAGNFIQYEYQDQPVLLPDYGAEIGIPIVTFAIGSYWDDYYRGRPFYRDRDSWYRRPMPHRSPPRPMDRSYSGRSGHPAAQYQRPEQSGATQQRGQNPGQRHGSDENHPTPQYQRPQQVGNRPEPQYQRPQQVGNHPEPQYQRPQQAGGQPSTRPEQAAQGRSQPQAHARSEGKPADHKDDHGDNGGH